MGKSVYLRALRHRKKRIIQKNASRLLAVTLQIGKVALRTWSDPQGDFSGLRIELEIIDDQAELLRFVHVQPRFAAFHLDFVLGPDTGCKSTYDSCFSGASCRDRAKSKSGYELYCVE
jgi:hypothetical protein